MLRLIAVASVAGLLASINAPAFACFADPNAQPRRLSLTINLPDRVTPSVVIEFSGDTYYVSVAAMDAILSDEDRVALWPSAWIDRYRAMSPLANDMPAFEPSGLPIERESSNAEEALPPGVAEFSLGRIPGVPEKSGWLPPYALADLIDRSEIAIMHDGELLESITRIQYDNVCDGGRIYRHSGTALFEVLDWIS
jgi:hypothetical protein